MIRALAMRAALVVGGLSFWLAGSSAMGGEFQPRQVPTYDARTFFETTSISGSSISADEKRILISSDASGVFNVYAQPVAGGAPEQLTRSTTHATFGVSWFPGDDRFLYTADQGGNELHHIYVRQLDGTDRDLTPGDNLKASFAGWSADDRSFYIRTNERDNKNFDLYRYDAATCERTMVFQNNDAWNISGISRDGRWIALQKTRTNADSDLYLADSKTLDAPPRHITPHQGDVEHGFLTFTPDSKQLYYSTNEHGEFDQAWVYDIASGQRSPGVTADWDVVGVSFSESGRYRVSAVNHDATTKVSIVETASGREVLLPDLPEGELSGVRFAPSDSLVAFYIDSDRSPANLFVYDLGQRKLTQLTRSINPKIDPQHLVDGQVVRYKSFDGREIPAILYRPWPASKEHKAPALVWVHGGPGGQSTKGYAATLQHLINHGYAILAVNNRGSSGYGKTFFHLDDRDHGGADLKDCVWGRKFLQEEEWVDGERIGIIGGSYGGYMVAAALAFEPEAFDAGINIFGVTNWVRTLESIPPWWADFRQALIAEMGDPAQDQARLRERSPLFHAKNIRKPLLVVQGANDPRVLKVESDEIVAAVKGNGVPVEYVVFPDEGHGFRKRENRIAASEAYLSFLNKYLRGG